MVQRESRRRRFRSRPQDQLWGAIGAVFTSWNNDRAKFYRRMHDIPDAWGTAVNVQSMVFGNMGETSATGVAFTRDPSTGDGRLYGEFLINAQGEDVVAGIRTPQPLTRAAREAMGDKAPSMEEAMPAVFAEFQTAVGKLERHYRDMQDIEFTVERGSPVHFADPQRQAHRQGGAEDRRRPGRRGGDQPRGGDRSGRPGLARPTDAPDHRRRRASRGDRRRPARLARRGHRARSCSPPRPPSGWRRGARR